MDLPSEERGAEGALDSTWMGQTGQVRVSFPSLLLDKIRQSYVDREQQRERKGQVRGSPGALGDELRQGCQGAKARGDRKEISSRESPFWATACLAMRCRAEDERGRNRRQKGK